MTKKEFLKNVEKTKTCWLWTRGVSKGYGTLTRPFKGKRSSAHRVSYELFVGPIPPGLYACHKCDVKRCVNPKHIFLGTQLDNIRDMDTKGRRVRLGSKGEDNPKSDLTNKAVRWIRKNYIPGHPKYGATAMAKKLGVTKTCVSQVTRGKTWKHV